MGDMIKLELDRNMVGQIIDGLRERAEEWERTMEYMQDGSIDPENPCILECSDAQEAAGIMNLYYEVIAEIERQVQERR